MSKYISSSEVAHSYYNIKRKRNPLVIALTFSLIFLDLGLSLIDGFLWRCLK
jgi:hypothetical protein